MVALLDRMDEGFVPTNALVHFQHAPLWGVLGRLSHHGLIRGEVDEANRRVNYVRCTPHPTDFRIWCIPKSGWPTV